MRFAIRTLLHFALLAPVSVGPVRATEASPAPAAAITPARHPQVALTFDDLPAHASLPPGVGRVDVARSVVETLRAAGAPPALGLVNPKALEDGAENAEVLRLWRAAGFPLGNHTFSHMDLQANTLAAFQQDVVAAEPALRDFMGDVDWHWFRFPYLRAGETIEKHRAVSAFLKEHGYKVAEVTLNFDDWAYNDPYARCMAKGDLQAIDWLQASYMARAAESLRIGQDMAQRIYGRDIKHVLLLHLGAFETVMLPRLLDLLKERGFELITLQDAEGDPAYALDPDLASGWRGTMLEHMMAARGLAPLRPAEDPFEKMAGVCR